MKFNPVKFGARVRRVRLSKNLSILKLAELSGLNKNTICNVESGNSKTTIDTVYKISTALSVEPIDLMDTKSIQDIDYVVKKRKYQEGRRSSRQKVNESTSHRIGDIKIHLDNGNIIAGIVEVFSSGVNELSSHDGEELFFCLTGKILVTINSAEVLLSKGDCVLFWGSEPHSYMSEQSDMSVGLSVISGSKHNSIAELYDFYNERKDKRISP